MRHLAILLTGVSLLVACNQDPPASGEHFAQEQQKALDKARDLELELQRKSQAQRKALERAGE